jgi:epidermal growth factor receptor substrate 15
MNLIRWSRNLADTQDRGALDLTDFIIGMYLIQASMYGQLSFMPSNLPPGLYEQAGGKSRSSTGSIIADATSGSGSHYSPPHALGPPPIPARSPIQSQITSQSPPKGILSTGPRLPARPPLNQGAATITSPFRPPTQSAAWDVTPAAKAGSDRYFDTLDKERKGYISGEVGGPFLMQSNLDSGTLATIWCAPTPRCCEIMF